MIRIQVRKNLKVSFVYLCTYDSIIKLCTIFLSVVYTYMYSWLCDHQLQLHINLAAWSHCCRSEFEHSSRLIIIFNPCRMCDRHLMKYLTYGHNTVLYNTSDWLCMHLICTSLWFFVGFSSPKHTLILQVKILCLNHTKINDTKGNFFFRIRHIGKDL